MRTLLETLKLTCGTFLAVTLLNGCVWGVKRVEITHGPLDSIQDKREGIIGVKPFTDARKGDRRKIGTVYSAVGPVASVKLKGDARLEDIVTGFVVETLKNAGYQAIITDLASSETNSSTTEKVPVILEGLITEFKVITAIQAGCKAEVNLLLHDAANGDVLLTTTIYGHGTILLKTGSQSEFNYCIRQAVDEALHKASTAFVSDAFYDKVRSANTPPPSNTNH